MQDGAKNVPVGKVIALLAEDGDDISNLKAPEDESPPAMPSKEAAPSPTPTPPSQSVSSSSSSAQPEHKNSGAIKSSKPVLPSVHRLLLENNISDADQIKGTGVRGMLTKGDVLAHLGKVSSPFGTSKKVKSPFPDKAGTKKDQVVVCRTKKLFVGCQVTNS